MINKDMTIKEATQYWVRGFNAIPQSFITEALGENIFDTFIEQIPELFYCRNCGHEFSEHERDQLMQEIEESDEDEGACPHCSAELEILDYREYNEEIRCVDYLPIWGTMWTFENSFDSDWALENLEAVYQCGFRVYQHDDLGVVIGIDGAGYDFYESHWIPLYQAIGLKWHKEE